MAIRAMPGSMRGDRLGYIILELRGGCVSASHDVHVNQKRGSFNSGGELGASDSDRDACDPKSIEIEAI